MTGRRRSQPAHRPERVRIAGAVAILGVPARTVQHLAAKGAIPGATKVGGIWTFDERRLRQWLAEGESRPTTKGYTSEVASFGRASPLPDASIDEAYRRAIGLSPASEPRRGARA